MKPRGPEQAGEDVPQAHVRCAPTLTWWCFAAASFKHCQAGALISGTYLLRHYFAIIPEPVASVLSTNLGDAANVAICVIEDWPA